MQSGNPINCPLRCAAPAQVVANVTMRQLVARQFPRHALAGRSVAPSIAHETSLEDRRQGLSERPSVENLPWQTVDRTRFVRSAGYPVASDGSKPGLPACKRPGGSRGCAAATRERDGAELRGMSSAALTDATESVTQDEDDGNSDTDAEEDIDGTDDGASDEGALTEMSSLCPLWDEMLPLDATTLKSKQVEHALKDLQREDLDRIMSAMEVLARLAWSDDEVRTSIALGSGIKSIVQLMRKWSEEPGLLCNACLCLMSLVRGDGPACEANQWQVAKGGGVEAVVGCMRQYPLNALVQLSALLCLIPLALDNASLQAHVATLALPAVISCLRNHLPHPDIQAKGLVVLGVLGQGEEAVHDAIRQQQLSVGATGRILESLRRWGSDYEEVLWAVLFSLAVLVRDGANPYQPAIRAAAAAGIPPLLVNALQTYKASAGEQADSMIITAGEFLLKTLGPAANQVMRERYGMAGLAMAPVVAASAVWAWRSAGR